MGVMATVRILIPRGRGLYQIPWNRPLLDVMVATGSVNGGGREEGSLGQVTVLTVKLLMNFKASGMIECS